MNRVRITISFLSVVSLHREAAGTIKNMGGGSLTGTGSHEFCHTHERALLQVGSSFAAKSIQLPQSNLTESRFALDAMQPDIGNKAPTVNTSTASANSENKTVQRLVIHDDYLSPSANMFKTEINDITLHVKGGASVIAAGAAEAASSSKGRLTNGALRGVVTCDEGVFCNDGVVDGNTTFSSLAYIPYAKVEDCKTTKWVQVDLMHQFLVSYVVLFWNFDAANPRQYCSLRLDVSKDGHKWSTIYKNLGEFSRKVSDDGGFWLTIPDEHAEARYVRWYSSRSDVSPLVEFVEMQVLGSRVHPFIEHKTTSTATTSPKPGQMNISSEGLFTGKDPEPPWRAGYGRSASRAPVWEEPQFPPKEWPIVTGR